MSDFVSLSVETLYRRVKAIFRRAGLFPTQARVTVVPRMASIASGLTAQGPRRPRRAKCRAEGVARRPRHRPGAALAFSLARGIVLTADNADRWDRLEQGTPEV